MTPDEARTMLAALEAFIADLSVRTNDGVRELERARDLRDRAAAVISGDPHVRDEDLILETIIVGDVLRVSTALMEEWVGSGGFSVAVIVRRIERDVEDGSKVLIISPVEQVKGSPR